MRSTAQQVNAVFEGVRHVCFDKDGTLTDVHTYWSHTTRLRARRIQAAFGLSDQLTRALCEAMGIDAGGRIKPQGPVGYYPPPVIIQAVVDLLAARHMQASVSQIRMLFEEVDAKQRAEDDYHVTLLPGVMALLQALRRRSVLITVFTSERSANAAQVLQRCGLGAFIAKIIGGDHVMQPKPHPEGFVLACKAVAVEPNASLYIGDTVIDLEVCKRGRARRGVAVASGLDSQRTLQAASPYVFAGAQELADLL